MNGLLNAMSQAIAPVEQKSTNITSTATTTPHVDSTKPIVPPTAQTGGFVNAGTTGQTSSNPGPEAFLAGPGFGGVPVFAGSAVGFGGGLASNPNVPRPGTSINPLTGQPHTAGLTRADLQAMKDLAIGNSTSSGVDPSLSGREQAARQLAGTASSLAVQGGQTAAVAHLGPGAALIAPTAAFVSTPTSIPAVVSPVTTATSTTVPASADTSSSLLNPLTKSTGIVPPNSAGLITPGLEMPGAWGSAPQVGLPGSGPNAPASVYEDVAHGLEKVGLAAYSIIPQSIKEVISPNVPNPSSPTTTRTTGATTGAPASPKAGSLFESAKAQTNSLLTQAQQTVQQARRSSVAAQGEGLIKEVKDFLGDVVGHTPFVAAPIGSTPETVTGRKASLPSQELLGAQPGDKSGGVGALPGKASETGVAVLPDEKKQSVNQGHLPGEVAAFGSSSNASNVAGPSGTSRDLDHGSSSGSHAVEALSPPPASSAVPEPAPHHESAPIEPATTPSVDLLSMPATAMALETLPEPTSSRGLDSTSSSAAPASTSTEPSRSLGSYAGLAAPLPATFLGTGAAHGATDLHALKGVSTESAQPSDANGTGLNPTSNLQSSSKPTGSLSPPSNDRSDSMASVTAIRGGTEGDRSPLAKQAMVGSALETVGEGQKSTTRGTGPEHTTSLTPGKVEDGVGHPSTRSTESNPTTRSTESNPITRSTESNPTTKTEEPMTRTEKVGAAGAAAAAAAGAGAVASSHKHEDENKTSKPSADEEQPSTTTNNTTTHDSNPSGVHGQYPMEGHDQPKSELFNSGKDTTGHEILKHDGVIAPEPTQTPASATSSSTNTDHHASAVDEVKGHQRTDSNASTGSGGKKKSGFMSKLKEKLHHH